MSQYQNLLEESRNNYFSPYEARNFISQEEVNHCIEIYNELPIFEPASHARATRKDYLMYNEHDQRMQRIFLPKLKNLFPDKKIVIDGGNFTYWHQPVSLHTDGYQHDYIGVQEVVKHNRVLDAAVLVPLDTDTHLGSPRTIFYNQTFFGGGQNFAVQQPNDSIGKSIDHFTFKDFEFDEESSSLLSHIPKENLYGFSVEKVIPWTTTSAVVWHRAQFHSAANFVGFNSKLHLIFFLCISD